MLHLRFSGKRSPLTFSVQELALIAITFIWGGTFLVVHLAMREVGPLTFVGVRFLTAGTISLILFGHDIGGLTRHDLKAGVLIGFAIAGGYGLQTVGLRTITSSQSAFITALYVPIVPLVQWLGLKRPPGLMSWIGVTAAFAGMVLLAGPDAGGLSLSFGELVTVVSTLAIASEILLISHFAPRVDSRRVTVIQLYAGSALMFVGMPIVGETMPTFSWGWVSAAIGLGLVSSLIQLIMNWAQKSVSPTRATLIYAAEPVWGGVVGKLAGDPMPVTSLAGGAMIVAGVVLSGFDRKRDRQGSGANAAPSGEQPTRR
jgi:drug/metabolite transporter (DMT)-like permease